MNDKSSYINKAIIAYSPKPENKIKKQKPMKQIGIINRKMIHERILAKQLNGDVIPYTIKIMARYKTIIFLAPFYSKKLIKLNKLKLMYPKKKVFVWWIGSDVWNAMIRKNNYDINYIRKMNVVHLSVSSTLKNELESLGIKSKVLTLIPNMSKYCPMPLPNKYTVAVYMPSTNLAFYRFDNIKNIVQKTPNINYIVYGNKEKSPISHYKNVTDLGWVSDTMTVIKNSNCLLRLTTHDGFPKSIIEFICCGRYAISNHDYPYVNNINDINKIIDILNMKPKLDKNAILHYNSNYTVKKLKEWFNG